MVGLGVGSCAKSGSAIIRNEDTNMATVSTDKLLFMQTMIVI